MLTFYLTSVAGGTDRQTVEPLIERIAVGDRTALERFYDQTHQALYAYILSVVKHPQDAQDILHDCYLSVVNHAGDYRAQGKPMAWVYTIARNRCMQCFRDRTKIDDTVCDEWLSGVGEREDFRADDRVVLTACMKQLTDEERQIVLLHAVSGFRHREIAQLLTMNLSTVLSKYHRALKKLKRELEGETLHE